MVLRVSGAGSQALSWPISLKFEERLINVDKGWCSSNVLHTSSHLSFSFTKERKAIQGIYEKKKFGKLCILPNWCQIGYQLFKEFNLPTRMPNSCCCQNGQNCPKLPKWSKIVQNGRKCSKIVQNGQNGENIARGTTDPGY